MQSGLAPVPQPPQAARLHVQKAVAVQPLPCSPECQAGVAGLQLSLITGLNEAPARPSEIHLIPSRVVQVLENLLHQLPRSLQALCFSRGFFLSSCCPVVTPGLHLLACSTVSMRLFSSVTV